LTCPVIIMVHFFLFTSLLHSPDVLFFSFSSSIFSSLYHSPPHATCLRIINNNLAQKHYCIIIFSAAPNSTKMEVENWEDTDFGASFDVPK